MNKKIEIVFVGFILLLYTFAIQQNIDLLYGNPSIFLSPILTSIFCLEIARVAIKRKKNILKTTDMSNLPHFPLPDSFFLLSNSFFIIGTMAFSGYILPFLFLSFPLFAGFNTLWIITKLKSFWIKQNYTTSSKKYVEKKKESKKIILIIIGALLLFVVTNLISPFIYMYWIAIGIPAMTLFDILWIIKISKSKNGVERERIIYKITLSLFGFNLLWNIIGFGINPPFVITLPLTISGFIYIVLYLRKIKDMESVNSGSEEINPEDLIDEHLDLMRKLNGNK